MAISDAVGADRVSTVLGYKLLKGNFATSTPNLPQRILVVGVPNTANASSVTPNVIEQHLTAKSVGDKYGYGSPMHAVMRILKPSGSDGIGGIPVFFSSQAETGTAGKVELTVTGTATAAGTVVLRIAGRETLDGGSYLVNYAVGDTADTLMVSMRDAVNAVLSSPVSGSFISGTDTEVTFDTKFKGLNSSVTIDVDYGANANGFTYAKNVTAGTGAPSVTTALNNIGDQWFTMVINTYSPESTTVLNELQAFNGKPGETSTGRYSGLVWRPFIGFTGVCTQAQVTAFGVFSAANVLEVTNAAAPAPGSAGMCYEAAANVAYVESVIANNTPWLDPINRTLPDMPAPNNMLLAMNSYDDRDFDVKRGMSTALWTGSVYQIKDLITTYHDTTDTFPVFRYVRDLYVDFNMKFAYFLLQNQFVLGKVLVPDDTVTSVQNSISPKIWTALVMGLIEDFESRGMLVDSAFSKSSIQVEIDATNPMRLNTRFDYKRSGIARIGSTNAAAGFYFGS